MECDVGRTCSMYGEVRNAYMILVREPEEGILLGRLIINGRVILKWI
jgi:hypothetical protein